MKNAHKTDNLLFLTKEETMQVPCNRIHMDFNGTIISISADSSTTNIWVYTSNGLGQGTYVPVKKLAEALTDLIQKETKT